MRILLVNDDGIHAPGLQALGDIARQLSDDVWTVAPESDQSGVSHSLSLNDPLRLRQIDEKTYAVKGTPTDCVIMAVRHIMTDTPPDLVLSGINRGQNAAEDVIYSGTVAGAREAAILGFPAIALSQAYSPDGKRETPWETAVAHGPKIIGKILQSGIPDDGLVNINFPFCAPDAVEGVAVTTQGRRDRELLTIEARHDGRNIPYFWVAFLRKKRDTRPGTDLAALADKRISVTPLKLDVTDEAVRSRLLTVFGA